MLTFETTFRNMIVYYNYSLMQFQNVRFDRVTCYTG